MALAIPPIGSAWVPYVPRPLFASMHGFDWAPFLNGRSGRTFAMHLRVFGVGVDLDLNEVQRRWAFSAGAHWLLNIALGRSHTTPAEYVAFGVRAPSPGRRYICLTVLGLMLDFGRDDDGPWGLRYFFNHRRIFYKRPAR